MQEERPDPGVGGDEERARPGRVLLDVLDEYKEEAIYVLFVLVLLWGLAELGQAL